MRLKRLPVLIGGILFPAFLLVILTPPVLAANDPAAKLSDLGNIIQRVISLLAPAAAIALLIMFLVAGWQFMNSSGDPKAVGQARSTLTYAIIGVILVVASWLILTIVKVVTGVDVTTLTFPS